LKTDWDVAQKPGFSNVHVGYNEVVGGRGNGLRRGQSCPASPIKKIERVTVDILWTPDGKRV